MLAKQPQLMTPASSDALQITDLFLSGIHWLNTLADKQDRIAFSHWAKLVRSVRRDTSDLFEKRLVWLWDSLIAEPGVRSKYGSRLIPLDEEWRNLKPFECISANRRFGIFLKNFRAYGAPIMAPPEDLRPDAEAQILRALFMQPGKARRLECCDVEAVLELRPKSIGPKNVEAASLKVEMGDVTIECGCLKVRVKSLNHAYTKASLRMEPGRRGPGGRAYDHVALREENGWKTLESIRRDHEKKLWSELLATP